jgi:hypothetical protein
MFHSFRKLLSVVATATLFLAFSCADACAQTGVRERWDTVSAGNNYLGVDVIAWARTRNNIGAERRVDEMLLTQLRLLNNNIELQRIAATAIKNGTSFYGATSFRRGGFTVRNDTRSSSGSVSYVNNATVFGSNPYLTVYIYFVPITIGANVGHTGVMNMSLLKMPNDGAMLSGAMETYAYGWASVSVGWPGARVGLRTNIEIGRQRFTGVLGAFASGLSTAYLIYESTPVRLLLCAWLELAFLNGSLTLCDVALGARILAPFLH